MTYTALLCAFFADIPNRGGRIGFVVLVALVIGSPLLFGGVIWHLRKSHSRSWVNEIAFAAAVSFFLGAAILILKK